MKNKLFLLPLLALVVALASWYNGSTAAKDADFDREYLTNYAEPDAAAFAGVADYVAFDYRRDTITNAEVNTINIGRRDNSVWNTVTTPTNFFSLYTYDISLKPVSLSGTQALTFCLDKSNARSGTINDWMAIDSITTGTNANIVQLKGTDATAARYRVRVKGAGTQSSTYQIWSIWKKKN